MFRTSADGSALEPAGDVPLADPERFAMGTQLFGDGAGRTWLTWWEVGLPGDAAQPDETTLYAVPVAPTGTPSGPVERWFVAPRSNDDTTRQPLVGDIGVVFPVAVERFDDAGVLLRDVHLLHRQPAGDEPIEDLTFTTAYTSFPVAVAPTGSGREIVVSYSTYPPSSVHGHGEMRRLGCREDLAGDP